MARMILVVLMVLAFAPAAGAAGGVLEINQACAVHTGCFSGDDANWPVQITAPGSYILTSNLVLPDADATAIEVGAPSVSIDLGGFEIVTAACLGAISDCTPESGEGSGIFRTDRDNRGISVKNGSVTGMGAMGVWLGKEAEVTNVRTRWNGDDGIYLDWGSAASGNLAYENGGEGIGAGGSSTISGNSVYRNDGTGILGNSGSTVSGNTAVNNLNKGISVGYGSMVTGNTIRNNDLWFSGVDENAGGYAFNVISDGGVLGGVSLGQNLCNGVVC